MTQLSKASSLYNPLTILVISKDVMIPILIEGECPSL